jgi:hypothetical protein
MASKVSVSAEPSETITEQAKAAPGKQKQNAPDQTRLEKSIAIAQRVVEAQKSAANLKERAKKAVNPRERIRLLKEAYQKEVEAHGQSKLAKRLSSGVWQGGTAGGGIGAGIAMSLGALTGTLVTGLVSIPTVLLGGLVGAGVGGIHGPWFTLGLGGEKKDKPKTDEEIRAEAMKEAEALDQAVEKGATTVPQPPKLDEGDETTEQSSEEHPQQRQASMGSQGSGSAEKRKPRKLQVRSGNEVKPAPERKKPKKLEVRSTAERNENA